MLKAVDAMGTNEEARVRQYEVVGVCTYRGFGIRNEPLSKFGVGSIGANYPAGPILFLVSEHKGVPAKCNRQYHQERLGPAVAGPSSVSLKRALQGINYVSENDLKQVDVARWRLTECQDMYPAYIDNGDLIHSATDKEIERLASQGIKLTYARNLELAHWALKTKAQIQSGTPPAALLSPADATTAAADSAATDAAATTDSDSAALVI